jgi:hypothetical protein
MTFSGEVFVLNKIAELAQRCGISPTLANVSLNLTFPGDNDDNYYYQLSMIDGTPLDDGQ